MLKIQISVIAALLFVIRIVVQTQRSGAELYPSFDSRLPIGSARAGLNSRYHPLIERTVLGGFELAGVMSSRAASRKRFASCSARRIHGWSDAGSKVRSFMQFGHCA